MGDVMDWPAAPCCTPDYPPGCVCPPAEKALRAWSAGQEGMPAMTAEQRAYCLGEIGKVEGYSRVEHEDEPDAQLARTTLSAWVDYCRDKGLL